MARLTDIELQRNELRRTIRAVARIHFNNQLARFLNEVENDAIDQFNETVAKGLPYEADLGALVSARLPKGLQ